ncbi:MAG TPA: pilus assembly protein [Vicinamibacterales bacterium]|jgi:Flp pilus assembly protein TadG
MRHFWSDQEGNVALLFALAMIPVIGSMGVALDYSMASAYRTDIQKALDATALALTRIMPADQATLDAVGNQYFQANLGPNTLTNLQLIVTPDVGKLKLSAKAKYKPQMAHIVGAETVDISTSAEAKWSIGKVEIALVLDNSWSMNSLGRMTELKKAAHNLLDVLQNAAKAPGDAKVAIIAFDSRVNVGTANVGAAWLKWNDWDAANGTCSKSQYTSQGSCTSNNGVWTPANHNTWNGCVWDRDKSNDTLDAAPTNSATNYPAWQCNHGLSNPNLVSPMLPLTINWGTGESTDPTTLHGKVNQMQPSGYTNITIGLVWGWHALSDTAVMIEAAANNTDNLQKYIILLTDGENTKNRFNDSESTMNTRTRATCTNIRNLTKADGTNLIKVYTIRLIDGDDDLLRDCATTPDMFKPVENASELSAIFSSIGSEIANLHLSR